MTGVQKPRSWSDWCCFLFQNLSQTQLLRQTLNKVTDKKSLNIQPVASSNLVCYQYFFYTHAFNCNHIFIPPQLHCQTIKYFIFSWLQEPLGVQLDQPGSLTLAMCQLLNEIQDTKKSVVTPRELFTQVCKKWAHLQAFPYDALKMYFSLLRIFLCLSSLLQGGQVQRVSATGQPGAAALSAGWDESWGNQSMLFSAKQFSLYIYR